MPKAFLVSILCFFLGGRYVNADQKPTILFEKDDTLLTTNLEILVLAGAVEDSKEKAGLSSLMSELMLRGTKKKKREQFQSELEKLGATLGTHTTPDVTFFAGKVIKENTKALLDLAQDFLLNPAFSEGEFKSLKEEAMGEVLHLKNQNQRLAGLALRKAIFANTPMEYPVSGGVSTLKRITLLDIQKAYNDRVHRGNVVFAVACPEKEYKEVEKKLTDIWNQLPDGARLTKKKVTPQFPTSTSLIVVNKPGTSTGSVLFGQPGITANDPDRYALNIGNFVFGGEPLISRLFRVVRADLGWTYAVGSTYHALGNLSNQPGLFAITSTPSVEFTAKTILKILSMWQNYHQDGLKDVELKLAQDSSVNSYPFEFESPEKRLEHKVMKYLYDVPILSPEEFEGKIRSVTNDGLVKTLKTKHTGDKWLVSVLADAKIFEKQLAEEQANIPAANRLKISKVLTPDQVLE